MIWIKKLRPRKAGLPNQVNKRRVKSKSLDKFAFSNHTKTALGPSVTHAPGLCFTLRFLAPQGLRRPPWAPTTSPTYTVHDHSILCPGLRVGDITTDILDGGWV